MTCLNVSITRNYALIATDSEVHIGDKLMPCTKVFALPHLSGVISGRGNYLAITAAFGAACACPAGDLFAQNIVEHLQTAWDNAKGCLGASDLKTAIVFVWWSKSADRIRGILCEGFEKGAGVVREIESTYNAPIYDDMGEVTIPTKPEGMRALMAIQVEAMKRNHPDQATGGNMFCTWVREGDIHTRDEGAIL